VLENGCCPQAVDLSNGWIKRRIEGKIEENSSSETYVSHRREVEVQREATNTHHTGVCDDGEG